MTSNSAYLVRGDGSTLVYDPLIDRRDYPPEQADELADRLASIQRVVGEGVDPRAVERLILLWPAARVKVSHSKPITSRMGRWTEVVLTESDDPEARCVAAVASCHPNDNYDRHLGVALAFGRALKAAKDKTEPGLKPGIAVGLFGPNTSACGFILAESPQAPGRGWRLVRLTAPVKIGDTRHAEGEVLELQASELFPKPQP